MRENQLWAALRAVRTMPETHQPLKLTRIETGTTALGVSDVEYVSDDWNGWVELKTSASWRLDATLRLRHPFDMQQLAWLASHHDVRRGLRSWLLIGVEKGKRWEKFLLLPPAAAVKVVAGRAPITLRAVCLTKGVEQCFTAKDALCIIAGERDPFRRRLR